MDQTPKFEDRDYAEWEEFPATEFDRFRLTTQQQTELVHGSS
jgi:hypothetical protein